METREDVYDNRVKHDRQNDCKYEKDDYKRTKDKVT